MGSLRGGGKAGQARRHTANNSVAYRRNATGFCLLVILRSGSRTVDGVVREVGAYMEMLEGIIQGYPIGHRCGPEVRGHGSLVYTVEAFFPGGVDDTEGLAR